MGAPVDGMDFREAYKPPYFDVTHDLMQMAQSLGVSVIELTERLARGETHWRTIGAYTQTVRHALDMVPAIRQQWRNDTQG